ncbi:HNH endonuclease [Planctomyces sp. SH-PL62]|uniref:HNH endonuclease n=1 Tax=Planctomyces sp. SH-PL62 TaxID=1636152 RepID=UPI003965781D
MVAEAVHGPAPTGRPEVEHLDGVKTANAPSNSEWVSHRENIRRASVVGLLTRGARHRDAKLSEDDVRAIRRRLSPHRETYREIALGYGVDPHLDQAAPDRPRVGLSPPSVQLVYIIVNHDNLIPPPGPPPGVVAPGWATCKSRRPLTTRAWPPRFAGGRTEETPT